MLQCVQNSSLWRVNRYSMFSQKSYFGDRFRIRSSIHDRSIFFFRSFLPWAREREEGLTSRWRMYRDSSRKHIQRSHVGKVVKALFALPSKLHALRLRNEFLSEVQILRAFFIWGTIAADNSEVSALRSSPKCAPSSFGFSLSSFARLHFVLILVYDAPRRRYLNADI